MATDVAYNMIRLLGETCAEVSAPEEKQMAGQERANLHQGLPSHPHSWCEEELLPIAERPYGKRG